MQPASAAEGYEVIAANLGYAMSTYALATDRGGVAELGGSIILVNSGVDYAVFNAAVLARPLGCSLKELESLLSEAAAYFVERRLPWSFWHCEDLLGGGVREMAPRALARRGLRLVAEHHGMVAESIPAPTRLLPPLVIRRVGDAETRRGFSRVTTEVFSVPSRVARQVYENDRFWGSDYIAWIGYIGGRPVCTAATESAAGVIGVYSVATLPAYQRQGYGEAITRHSLAEARRATGLQRTVLQSTQRGLTLYRGMGYRTLTKFSVYISS